MSMVITLHIHRYKPLSFLESPANPYAFHHHIFSSSDRIVQTAMLKETDRLVILLLCLLVGPTVYAVA